MGHFIDIAMSLSGLFLSAYIAFRFKYIGFILGAILLWVYGILRMELIMSVDSEYNPGVIGFWWVHYASIYCLLWCVPFTLSKFIYDYLQSNKQTLSA